MSGAARLLFATGGTGGHIYPALAVAALARAAGDEVSFIGQAGGMEERIVPEAGFEFEGVPAGKWNRTRPDPREAFRAAGGLSRAVRHVKRLKPDLVIGFGGFASFPGCVAAVLTGTPLVLQEGNAYPSRVNRWFAPRARLVISAQEEALARLSAKESAVIPFPVREERLERSEARRRLGVGQDAVVTLVMGGSQGSVALNRFVPEAYERLPEGLRPTVVHSAGPRWAEGLKGRTAAHPDYHVHPYLDAAAAWAAADLAITRAGIGTLSEAALFGVPLIMLPLPSSAEDHQLHNARAVEAAGAGRLLEERDAGSLHEVWSAALAPEWRKGAAEAARARSPQGAAARILSAAKGAVTS